MWAKRDTTHYNIISRLSYGLIFYKRGKQVNQSYPATLTDEYSTIYTVGLLEHSKKIALAILRMYTINSENELFQKPYPNVIAIVGQVDEIDFFVHPIVTKEYVFIDARALINKEGVVRSTYEFNNLVRRALYDFAWVNNNGVYLGQSELLSAIYSRWFGSSVRSHYGVDMRVSANIEVVAAIFYNGLFQNELESGNNDIEVVLLRKIPKITGTSVDVIEPIISENMELITNMYGCEIPPILRFKSMMELLSIVSDNSISFDATTVQNSMCKGAVAVTNSIMLASIALMHPAALANLTYLCSLKGIQNNTIIGRIINNNLNRLDMSGFDKFNKILTEEQ